eukprot:3161452-Pyramimonas_sp.AAC.1
MVFLLGPCGLIVVNQAVDSFPLLSAKFSLRSASGRPVYLHCCCAAPGPPRGCEASRASWLGRFHSEARVPRFVLGVNGAN